MDKSIAKKFCVSGDGHFDYEGELSDVQDITHTTGLIMDLLLEHYLDDCKDRKLFATLDLCRILIGEASRKIDIIYDDFQQEIEDVNKRMNSED